MDFERRRALFEIHENACCLLVFRPARASLRVDLYDFCVGFWGAVRHGPARCDEPTRRRERQRERASNRQRDAASGRIEQGSVERGHQPLPGALNRHLVPIFVRQARQLAT